jgi:energy-coupling factor transporter ATP-binding protein EcfA2
MWHRWDPHLHAPGTVLNDQFGGKDPWDEFLKRIELSDPPIRALGITDYLSLDCYEKVVKAKEAGRLPSVTLIFPNVEMRFSIETAKSAPINVHLLFSPEAPDHVSRIKRFLSTLEFQFGRETYRCQRDDLIRLGRAYDSKVTDDNVALSVGTNQFKVSFEKLREEWKKSEWVHTHGLIAVAGGEKDGTAGLRDPTASFGALRKEIETLARMIFTGNPKQTEFWLGRGAATLEELDKSWGGMKPCLHGSDAHEHGKVGVPDYNRYSWIKGDLTFETLLQACIDPEGRVFVGTEPPRGGLPAQTITELSTPNSPWLTTGNVQLNPGLVAVIGARGSGKTALVDLVAAGGYALSPHLNARSFIKRAFDYLGDSSAVLKWESGEETSNLLRHTDIEELLDVPRVQYLSQQFVDQLCSADGLGDDLIAEIERVIFQVHRIEDRMGASSFRELLDLRTARPRASRDRHKVALAKAANQLTEERGRKAGKQALIKQQEVLVNAIKQDKKDRQFLIGKGNVERTTRFDEVSTAAEQARLRVEKAKRRIQQLLALKDEVKDIKEHRINTWLADLKEGKDDAGLSEEVWKSFRLSFVGDVDDILTKELHKARKTESELSGPSAGEVQPDLQQPPLTLPYIAAKADLSQQTLSLLEKEQTRLRRLVGIDATNAKKLQALSDKITKQEGSLEKLTKEIEFATQADARITELINQRKNAYEGIIESLVEEEHELSTLYAPLATHLANQTGSLKKLTFSVRRTVDVETWATAGEKLLDLRVNGPFKGKGTLLAIARAGLVEAWERGSQQEVSAAMALFRDQHEQGLIDHAPVPKTEKEAYRAWARRVSDWLYSTSHVSLSYGVQYDSVEIEQLSPGTRGIVLLLLYLAIESEDDRPLIIDQPEENLDPQSIFQELVRRFRDAKLRRQIIIVTHNANLVVNTDADQVIVAKCGPHRPGQLPEITYESGGLENPLIRRHVCDILEGGEAAFRERAKRLRVGL